MARYIDADALLENLKKQYGEELGWQCTINMSDVGMMIEDAPTADVVSRAELAVRSFQDAATIYALRKRCSEIAWFLLSELKKDIHNKAVFPGTQDVHPYINLKVLDGIIQNYINRYYEEGKRE